jgi:CBS domain-containing protein
MTARDLMKTDIGACAPDDELVTVLMLMRERQCGWAPVIDSRGRVVGVVTDRDAAMSLLNHPTRGAARVHARDAMTRDVVGCTPSATLNDVLDLMATHHVRRLPVRDAAGHLQGVISIDDIVLATGTSSPPDADEVLGALRRIVSRPTVAQAGRAHSGRPG